MKSSSTNLWSPSDIPAEPLGQEEQSQLFGSLTDCRYCRLKKPQNTPEVFEIKLLLRTLSWLMDLPRIPPEIVYKESGTLQIIEIKSCLTARYRGQAI